MAVNAHRRLRAKGIRNRSPHIAAPVGVTIPFDTIGVRGFPFSKVAVAGAGTGKIPCAFWRSRRPTSRRTGKFINAGARKADASATMSTMASTGATREMNLSSGTFVTRARLAKFVKIVRHVRAPAERAAISAESRESRRASDAFAGPRLDLDVVPAMRAIFSA